jgi:hypothetical protein
LQTACEDKDELMHITIYVSHTQNISFQRHYF